MGAERLCSGSRAYECRAGFQTQSQVPSVTLVTWPTQPLNIAYTVWAQIVCVCVCLYMSSGYGYLWMVIFFFLPFHYFLKHLQQAVLIKSQWWKVAEAVS